MPQDICLDIPFPARIHPGEAEARERNIDWLVSNRWLTREENVVRFRTWRLSDMGARFHPGAVTTDDLDLGVQQQAFYFFLDDLFDSPLGAAPSNAHALVCHLAEIARHGGEPDAVTPGFPLAEMFAGIWDRSRRGMSEAWCRRAGLNWEAFFLSYVTEAVNTATGTVMDLGPYRTHRQVSIGAEGVLDIIERCGGFEAPPELHESSCFREMRALSADVIVLTNDVQSLEKDEANREPNNAVTLLSRERGHCRQEALETVQDMVREHITRFHVLSAQARRLCTALGLTAQQCEAAERFVDACRIVMRANYDWGNACGRYSPDGVERKLST